MGKTAQLRSCTLRMDWHRRRPSQSTEMKKPIFSSNQQMLAKFVVYAAANSFSLLLLSYGRLSRLWLGKMILTVKPSGTWITCSSLDIMKPSRQFTAHLFVAHEISFLSDSTLNRQLAIMRRLNYIHHQSRKRQVRLPRETRNESNCSPRRNYLQSPHPNWRLSSRRLGQQYLCDYIRPKRSDRETCAE